MAYFLSFCGRLFGLLAGRIEHLAQDLAACLQHGVLRRVGLAFSRADISGHHQYLRRHPVDRGNERRVSPRYILTTGIVGSLSVLAYFKYFNFFIDTLSHLAIISPRISALVLPLGISFFTFHSISYMVDTYRRRIQPTWNFVDVALYILFLSAARRGPDRACD